MALPTRDDLITGLRDLADWLEANPAVPADGWGRFQYSADNHVPDGLAVTEVDRVAELAGKSAERQLTHHVLTVEFGCVEYIAVACNVYPDDDSDAETALIKQALTATREQVAAKQAERAPLIDDATFAEIERVQAQREREENANA